jgi:hypothetical protein
MLNERKLFILRVDVDLYEEVRKREGVGLIGCWDGIEGRNGRCSDRS